MLFGGVILPSVMYSPLEQFEVIPLSLIIKPFLYLTNSSFLLGLILLAVALLIRLRYRSYFFPRKVQRLSHHFACFTRRTLMEILGAHHLKYFAYIYALFLLILLANLFGMVPYTFTVTGHFVVTLALSSISFIGLNILGVLIHGSNLLSLFLPSGTPLFIAPFVIGIEVISYLARMFSLAIRLFANLMSGHILLKILSNFVWLLLIGLTWETLSTSLYIVAALPPTIIIFLVTGLELAIAMVQAYVFTILFVIYTNDVIHLH
jgi:ATP synthase subunit 6